jgi:Zn-dependent protease
MKKVTDEGSIPVYAPSSRFKTSRTELLHLILGVSVFFIIEAPFYLQYGTMILFTIASIITVAFVLHELAHKFTAQNFGLWSEFRLDMFGTLISLLTTFSPFKIIAPGAVVVFGSRVTREKMGKIALAGPIANIVQILLFVFLSRFVPILRFAALLNANLAVFNLLPISVLDGRKVYLWSKKAFMIVFGTALILWMLLRIIF